MILGARGYLGSATWAHLEARGHEVIGMDSEIKDHWMGEAQVAPLFMASRMPQYTYGDVCKHLKAEHVQVDAIIHYAEQPSAPWSMANYVNGMETIQNNVTSTYAVIQAVRAHNPDCHIIKLGTMGEYGTPGVNIPEGWFEYLDEPYMDGRESYEYVMAERTARLPFPKQPGSLYHTTKVMDSDLLEFAARIWDLRVTDLNQGIVYGCTTNQLERTNFYYDQYFGTALNRFVTQAVAGIPLTVYGEGGQTRGWLNIRDTLACVELALLHPAKRGEFKVFNQFTETFSVGEIALRVAEVAKATVAHIDNPRKEREQHYYHASNEGFKKLGLVPWVLTYDVIAEMVELVQQHKDKINKRSIMPEVKW